MSNNIIGHYFTEQIDCPAVKKNFDGSYTYIFDVSKKDYTDYDEVQNQWNSEYSTLAYVVVIYGKE